jgi:hypothetical protein
MFPHSYFAKTHFPGRYWPPIRVVGGAIYEVAISAGIGCSHLIRYFDLIVPGRNVFRHTRTKIFFNKRETK